MKELLFLAHRIPYPPNKGDKIRSFHWLKALATRYRVHLGAFADDEADLAHVPRLSDWCDQVSVRPLRARTSRLRSLSGLAHREPLSFAYYRDRKLARWVTRIMRTRPIEAIVVFSSAMAPYVADYRHVRRVLDFVDVDSEKWRAYADNNRGAMRRIYAREGRCLLSAERRLAADFDAGVFVSEAELGLFERLAPECAPRLVAIGNGVDSDYFDPALDHADPYDGQGATQLVFTGAMDYAANVDAVTWFARDVWPRVRERVPEAGFWIVGTRPSRQARELAQLPGIRVTGAVADVRPYLAHARLAVAPMRIARGLQNKVLEALAMGKPLVLTPDAATGLRPLGDGYAALAETAADFAAHVLGYLNDTLGSEIATAARAFAVEHYGWPHQTERFLSLVDGRVSPRSASPAWPTRSEELACLRSV